MRQGRQERQELGAARTARRPQTALGALALAVALGGLGTLAACTGGGSGGANGDGKSSLSTDQTVSPAPPGKYKTLPQPCIAVDLDTLKALVPGAKNYDGAEALTYDTDRRVGCTWRAKAPDGSGRSLVIDMERVVSYDPGVSDEVEAGTDYDEKAAKASIPPLPLPGSTPTKSPTTPPTGAATATPAGSAGDGGGSAADLGPRRLTDVGNAAFIYDTTATKTATAGPRCDVTLVFQTANVIVSIRYGQSAALAGAAPQRAELQEGAQKVAQQLERKVES